MSLGESTCIKRHADRERPALWDPFITILLGDGLEQSRWTTSRLDGWIAAPPHLRPDEPRALNTRDDGRASNG